MLETLRRFTLCCVVFSLLIGQGDGKWKRKNKKILEQDVAMFRRMAENVEHDIEDFYDDYPDEETLGIPPIRIQEPTESSRNPQQHVKISDYGNEGNDKDYESSQFNSQNHTYAYVSKKQITLNIRRQSKETKEAIPMPVGFKSNDPDTITDDNKIQSTSWPKFEDIILAIGKRYDWKNDRWIKVKDKLRKTSEKLNLNYIRSEFLSKHQFNYRTVKLNRGKSKRNVIIAVKAVR